MEVDKYVPLKGFENEYEIRIEQPHRVRRIGSDYDFVDCWFNGYGDEAAELKGKLYTIDELVEIQFDKAGNR